MEDQAQTVGDVASIEITEQELLRRKDFLEFGEHDVANLIGINDLAQGYANSVIEDFYNHLLSFEETRAFFHDREVLERVKKAQVDYFLRLTSGKYDVDYARNRLVIGAIHERINLPVKAYLGMYNYYLRAVAKRLSEAYSDAPQRAWSVFLSLMKLKTLDMGLVIDTYINSRERTIRRQQETLQELPTPVLPFREGMLLVPIIGVIDSVRARLLTEQLLGAVRDNRAKVIVIDITGVQAVDSKVANHMIQTVEAARLMGATAILAGVSPQIAQTMVTLGIDLGRIVTVSDLQSAIERAEAVLGYSVTKVREKALVLGEEADMRASILKQNKFLIASVQDSMTDSDLLRLREDLTSGVRQHRSTGVLIDVGSLDVMDSFAVRTLRGIAQMVKLLGAECVVVGIQPDVAFSMVQLGLTLEGTATALDLEDGLALLNAHDTERAVDDD